MKLELPRGMRDLEPEDLYNINYIREKFVETVGLFNFKLIEPSPIEMLDTLEAKAGASISQEIYNFTDKGDRNVALRFDLTIGMTRFVAARRDFKMPSKVAAFAGVWRYDEPQANRYRYFHQWDIELYGPFNLEADAEVIEFVSVFLKKLGLDIMIEINDRQLIEEYIRQKLGLREELAILEMLRAIDKFPKKDAKTIEAEYRDKFESSKLQAILSLSKIRGNIDEIYSKTELHELENWDKLAALMDSLKTRQVNNVRINFGIVRGLDYYSGIVFEAFDPSLESDALVGGGRYDKLPGIFGRSDLGATGAAGGVERIIGALKKKGILYKTNKQIVYVATTSEVVRSKALEIASNLRNDGITIEHDILSRPLRKQLDDAATRGVTITIIITPEDIKNDEVIVREMDAGVQNKEKLNDLPKNLKRKLSQKV